MNGIELISRPATAPGSYPGQTGTCPRVLYVDDNDFVRDGFCSVLSVKGWQCEGANCGDDALLRLTSAPDSIDFLITDHQMPEMTGLEFVRQVRATGYTGRILVYSTMLRAQERVAYLQLGVDAIVPKTGNVELIYEAIEELQQSSTP